MKILVVGDVYGKSGCECLIKSLPELKSQIKPDLTIVNGENSAEGNGIIPSSADMIFSAGADVITGGNHSLRRKEMYSLLDENPFILRPANLPKSAPGKGIVTVDLGYTTVAVINLMGVVYLENLACPFETADELIKQADEMGAKIKIIDFHAEATSEKRALGFYLDGKVSAIFGTHTHVQTSDIQILPKGTGYITDVGMTGVKNSVLGTDAEIIIKRLKDKIPEKFKGAVGETELCGCVFNVDNKSGLTESVDLIRV